MTHPYLVRSDWKTCIRCGVQRRVGGRRGDGGLCRDCHQTDPKFPYNQKKETDSDAE